MIDPKILERLQGNAIISPDSPVPLDFGALTIYVKALDRYHYIRLLRLLVPSSSSLTAKERAAEIKINLCDFIDVAVVKVEGELKDAVTDDVIDLDLSAEPKMIDVATWYKVFLDVVSLSELTGDLSGKFVSPLILSEMDGPALKAEGVTEAATKQESEQKS